MSDDLLIGAILNFESRVGLPWQCIKLGEDKRMKTQRQTERDKRRRRRRILHLLSLTLCLALRANCFSVIAR